MPCAAFNLQRDIIESISEAVASLTFTREVVYLIPTAILSSSVVSFIRFPVYASVSTVVTAEHTAGNFDFFGVHDFSSFLSYYFNFKAQRCCVH